MYHVVTGTGRCGTAAVTYQLRALGINARHEWQYGPIGFVEQRTRPQVEVSWMAAPHLEHVEADQLWQVVRDPIKVVNSLVGIGFFDRSMEHLHGAYIAYARDHCSHLPNHPVTAAAAFVVRWNEMIERSFTTRVRIEDLQPGLSEGLNHRKRGKIRSYFDIPDMGWRKQLKQMAHDYGYKVD